MSKTESNQVILRIAVPSPLRRCFDYLGTQSGGAKALEPGVRIEVPFGRTVQVGVLIETVQQAGVEIGRLKPILQVLDEQPCLSHDVLQLLLWASRYYAHPLGEVLHSALPLNLRKAKAMPQAGADVFQLIPANIPTSVRGAKQSLLIQLLQEHPDGLDAQQLNELLESWRVPMKALLGKGWVQVHTRVVSLGQPGIGERAESAHLEIQDSTDANSLCLNDSQRNAVDSVTQALGRFQVFLLEGITGSGKTEVYLRITHQVLRQGYQVLILVPEIGLTPQLLTRFRTAMGEDRVAVMHSGLSAGQRMLAWTQVAEAGASVLIGTRSAVFAPFKNLGFIVVDEEHDLSFKQQDGFRYHARDIAVRRAQQLDVPVLLGSATPSLESLHNVYSQRYRHLELPQRAGTALNPKIQLLDVRNQPLPDGFSVAMLGAIQECLQKGEQVLLFLNRRGFAPVLMCHACGWVAGCKRCDSHMTLYQSHKMLRCHHCGAQRPAQTHCPECAHEDMIPLGQGTERLEQCLQSHFPGVELNRVDRDSTRRKGSLQQKLEDITQGKSRILIGTQMLAKGHHFPNVTLVGIMDVDQGLFSADFRASERMAQLVVQVAGRSGRGDKAGRVLIQTHHPDHPLLQTLITQGYKAFATLALQERQAAGLPPFSHLVLLRAEAVKLEPPFEFLTQAAEQARLFTGGEIFISDPVAAPMERRAGRYRAQLLLQCNNRQALHRLLLPWAAALEGLASGRKVRWSIDVDPQEMY
ncbi:MAG: primosomal protein N' [Gammaproteobacteria bacterium]|nr:primosomal protein N' [Gammaproteobacteria bacterium]MDH5799809.1 primosomal protein N' [Gammaproteobacteria bacterium]